MAFSQSVSVAREISIARTQEVFQRIIPPSKRMWMWDCIDISTGSGRPGQFCIEYRVRFCPKEGVQPKTEIAFSQTYDDRAYIEQRDIFDDHALEDFLIKCLMVYSMEDR